MKKPITSKQNSLALFKSWLPIFLCFLCTYNLKAQCNSIECNNDVTLYLKDDCKGYVNPFFMMANPYACGGPATIDYYDQNGTYLGDTLNFDHIGMTVNAFLTNQWTGLTCTGTVNVVDGRAPVVECEHINIKCTEENTPVALGEPYAFDNCTDVMSLEHEDEIIDLGCGMQGFQGYFEPSAWTVKTTNGDGGVDVTGAPNAVLVEGANSSLFKTSPRYITRFKIVVPAEGYISFDWSSFGGSNFNVNAFFVTINGVCIQLSFNDITEGSWQSWLLEPGDVLSFEQASDGTMDIKTEVSNFQFITTAQKIIHRNWTAIDDFGNKGKCLQVITIERSILTDVFFPENKDGIQAAMLNCGDGSDPLMTGYPFLDEDGNTNTSDDQYPIVAGECTFSMTYEDQSIITCEGNELILREWTVLDNCTNQFLQEVQIIKIFDTTAPQMTCPADMVIGTDSPECGMTIDFPTVAVYDDCSSNIDIQPSWSFGSGFGPFEDIPLGTFPVTYTVTDDCGNSTSCTFSVTIEDDHPPTVVCDGFTVASLGSDGTALIFADVINDGSYDLCCLEGFEIKKAEDSNLAYSNFLEVDCSDAGSSFLVHMKAIDCAGNFSFCEVEVMVADQSAPALLAPADVTVDCNEDLSDLSIFGTAIGIDNCSMQVEEQVGQVSGNCGEGSIIRSWIATDDHGNVNIVSQTISIQNQVPWNLNNDLIIWPQDYFINQCNVDLSPSSLSNPFKEPQFLDLGNCESVAASWNDELLWISEPSCYVIYRTWTVLDFCQYEANSGSDAGSWEYVQTLTVTDNEAPVFLSQTNNIVVSVGSSNTCTANVDLSMPLVEDCSDHIVLSAQGDLGFGFSFSNVSVGLYNMTYFASDGCGNTQEHNFVVTVQDNLIPNALCVNNLQVDLNDQGEIMVTAEQLNFASFDNCTASNNLQFSFSSNINDKHRTYTCDNLGQNQVDLYVTDENGNQGICQTNILVNDGFDACLQNPDVIAGSIQTTFGEGISQVFIHLESSLEPAYFTNLLGTYDFSGNFEGNDYTIRPHKDINANNGVTSFDLALINDHVLGAELLDSPYKLIAADANNSGSVTVGDLVVIQRVILFMDDYYENNTSWRFIPTAYSFPDDSNPFSTPFPETIPLVNVNGDISNADFVGIKIGDVSENVDPDVFVENITDDRGVRDLVFNVNNEQLEVGKMISITFSSAEFSNTRAFQFTLDFDPTALEFVNIENPINTEISKPKFGTNLIDEGAITALWYNDRATQSPKQTDLFTLNFIVKSSQLLSAVLEISSRFTEAIAFSEDDELMNVELQFIENKELNTVFPDFKLLQNVPNPLRDECVIEFILPETEKASLSFYDVSGKLLYRLEKVFESGSHLIIVERQDLKLNSGIVYYELKTKEKKLTKRLIVIP